MGFLNVSVLDGGLSEWAKHNYPMERGAHLPVSKSRIPRASPEEVLANTPTGQIIIDSRPIIEFSAGHLPGARNLPLEEILKASPSLPKEAEIIVYDRQSARSRQAVQKLLDAGCKASELSGGLAAWVKKGYPVEVK
jgi:rhodanese-related sulfurtransferase